VHPDLAIASLSLLHKEEKKEKGKGEAFYLPSLSIVRRQGEPLEIKRQPAITGAGICIAT